MKLFIRSLLQRPESYQVPNEGILFSFLFFLETVKYFHVFLNLFCIFLNNLKQTALDPLKNSYIITCSEEAGKCILLNHSQTKRTDIACRVRKGHKREAMCSSCNGNVSTQYFIQLISLKDYYIYGCWRMLFKKTSIFIIPLIKTIIVL